MSTLELGRVHMTVKVKDDMVEYKPKERRCERANCHAICPGL